jgi:hypothetical protein
MTIIYLGSYDGMLVGKGGEGGAVLRVFDPPRWRVDRWAAWFVGVGLERLRARFPKLFRAKPSRQRGTVVLNGRIVRVVEVDMRIAHVPRIRR